MRIICCKYTPVPSPGNMLEDIINSEILKDYINKQIDLKINKLPTDISQKDKEIEYLKKKMKSRAKIQSLISSKNKLNRKLNAPNHQLNGQYLSIHILIYLRTTLK